jgi:hypothetical protein
MSKAREFHSKSRIKNTEVASQQAVEVSLQTRDLMGRVLDAAFKASRGADEAVDEAKLATRSLVVLNYKLTALIDLLSEGLTPSAELIRARSEKFVIEDFDTRSAQDDTERNLLNADSKQATNGLIAVVRLDVFKNGTLIQEQSAFRSKMEIGKAEIHPAVDAAMEGLKVGESKDFPITLANLQYEAKVTLLGLREKAPVETPAEPVLNQEAANNEA